MTEENMEKQEAVETDHGNFILVKDFKEAFELKTFSERYVDYLDHYIYIVGDVSGEKLRLKGFAQKDKDRIFDYLMESTTPNAPYFILKRRKEN